MRERSAVRHLLPAAAVAMALSVSVLWPGSSGDLQGESAAWRPPREMAATSAAAVVADDGGAFDDGAVDVPNGDDDLLRRRAKTVDVPKSEAERPAISEKRKRQEEMIRRAKELAHHDAHRRGDVAEESIAAERRRRREEWITRARARAASNEPEQAAVANDVAREETYKAWASAPETKHTDEGNAASNERGPLNVVLLYPDDWRHDTIGGVAPIVRTPYLNELATEGIRFTHNCVTTSICWVSRATLFTGQYLSRHKSYRLKTPEFYRTFHNESWPGRLRAEAGYHTGHFGKWQYEASGGLVGTFYDVAKINGGKHYQIDRQTGKLVHDSDVSRDNAVEFLETRPKDRPFAMTVAFYPPKAVGTSEMPGGQWKPKRDTMHLFVNDTVPMPTTMVDHTVHRNDSIPPFMHHEGPARGRYKQRFNTTKKYQGAMKNYYRLVYTVDQACKTIVDKLKEQGEYDNTLIIFTTDNGLFHGEHGFAGKWYPYQESIRVPLIIRDPRMPASKRGTLDDSLTLNVDLASTILGAAGLENGPRMQGRDVADLYLKTDARKWREEFFYEYTIKNGPKFPVSTALVRRDFKYIRYPGHKLQYPTRHEQLYHLAEDPLERHDLILDPKYEDLLVEMRARHDELEKEAE